MMSHEERMTEIAELEREFDYQVVGTSGVMYSVPLEVYRLVSNDNRRFVRRERVA